MARRPTREAGKVPDAPKAEAPLEPQVLVLDTTAFIARLTLYAPRSAELATTPSAAEEARDPSSREAVELARSLGRLQIEQPPPQALREAQQAARRHGIRGLSSTDLELAALALAYKQRGRRVTLVTDDYALQALAARLGIPFQPLRTRGIQSPSRPRRPPRPPARRCPACGAPIHQSRLRHCPVCGAPL